MHIAKKAVHHDNIWKSKHNSSENLNEANESVISLLPECKTVVDIGCGKGNLAIALKSMGKDVCGLDISAHALSEAKGKGIEIQNQDLDSPLKLKDSSFDCAISCQVLQHIYRPSDLIREMSRVSKKYIIINVPNIAYWRYRLRLLHGKLPFIGKPEEIPIRYFTLETLKKTIDDCDLKIDTIAFTGSAPLKRFFPGPIRTRIHIRDRFPEMFATGFTLRCMKK